MDAGPISGELPDEQIRTEDRPVCIGPKQTMRQVCVLVEKLRLRMGGRLLSIMDNGQTIYFSPYPAHSTDPGENSSRESDGSDSLSGLGDSVSFQII